MEQRNFLKSENIKERASDLQLHACRENKKTDFSSNRNISNHKFCKQQQPAFTQLVRRCAKSLTNIVSFDLHTNPLYYYYPHSIVEETEANKSSNLLSVNTTSKYMRQCLNSNLSDFRPSSISAEPLSSSFFVLVDRRGSNQETFQSLEVHIISEK